MNNIDNGFKTITIKYRYLEFSIDRNDQMLLIKCKQISNFYLAVDKLTNVGDVIEKVICVMFGDKTNVVICKNETVINAHCYIHN